MKRLIRKGEKPLQQLMRRLTEYGHKITHQKVPLKNGFSKKHHSGPLINNSDYKNQYREYRKDSLYFKCDDNKDDCILLKSDTIKKLIIL